MARKLYEIARDIQRAWSKPYFGAVPYLQALRELENPASRYGVEDGRTIALYFLGNASTFRGPEAKALKAELKTVCGIK